MNEDMRRELTKVREALAAAEVYFMHQNEGFAAAHMNPKVHYWPLTTTIMGAHRSISRLLEDYTPSDGYEKQANHMPEGGTDERL